MSIHEVTLRDCAVCACESEPFPNCPGCGGLGGFTKATIINGMISIGRPTVMATSPDRLSALAPEMLAALKAAEEESPPEDTERSDDGHWVWMSWRAIDAMRAAIAKAEGQP